MKQKKLPTRKKRALRWLAAACLLLALNQIWGLYCFTPKQALRQAEEEILVRHGEILLRTEEQDGSSTPVFFLSAGEDALLLGQCSFYWIYIRQGWVCSPCYIYVDPEKPVQIRETFLASEDIVKEEGALMSWTETPFIFGCVSDPNVVEVEVTFEELENNTVTTKQIPASEFAETEAGYRVFWAKWDEAARNSMASWRCTAVGVYADGSVTERANVLDFYGIK